MNANRYGKFPFFLGTFYTFHLTDGTIKTKRMILTRVKWGTHPIIGKTTVKLVFVIVKLIIHYNKII